MIERFCLAAGLMVLVGGTHSSATAQDAAETAVISAGTSAPQARSSRSLGSAISGSMRRATGAITIRPRGGAANTRGTARGTTRGAAAPHAIASDVDALEGTDAPGYTLGNGASIRVSGRLNPAPGTVCTRNCPKENMLNPETPAEPEG